MPARPEDRTTINVGEDLLRAVRQRAGEEGRSFNETVSAALRLYLAGPVRPSENLVPGLASATPGLHADVQVLLAEVRGLVPRLAAVVENHEELMDAVDEITAEIGRRQGAAHALEQARHFPSPRRRD